MHSSACLDAWCTGLRATLGDSRDGATIRPPHDVLSPAVAGFLFVGNQQEQAPVRESCPYPGASEAPREHANRTAEFPSSRSSRPLHARVVCPHPGASAERSAEPHRGVRLTSASPPCRRARGTAASPSPGEPRPGSLRPSPSCCCWRSAVRERSVAPRSPAHVRTRPHAHTMHALIGPGPFHVKRSPSPRRQAASHSSVLRPGVQTLLRREARGRGISSGSRRQELPCTTGALEPATRPVVKTPTRARSGVHATVCLEQTGRP